MSEVIVIQSDLRKTEKQRLRVGAYARVSSNSLEQEDSFHNQVRYYTKYITFNHEWEFVDIYADEGITGTRQDKRDDFNRMIQDAEDGKLDLIVVKSISRFARNTVDCIRAVEKLNKLGVAVKFEDGGLNTSTPTDAAAIKVSSALAQEESQSIALNVRIGTRNKMKNGTYIQVNAPYGYSYKDKKLIINEEQAEVVRKIFEEYMAGKGTTEIARSLTELRIPNKNGKEKWSASAISYIISNVRYKGDALLQKSYTDGFPYKKIKNTGELDMYYLHNANEPIVSAEIFDMANTLLEKRQKKFTHTTYGNTGIFTKMIYCKNCGTPYKHKGDGVWTCRTHDINIEKCNAQPVTEELIKKAYILMYNRLKANYKHILIPFVNQIEAMKNNQSEKDAITELNIQIAQVSERVMMINRLKDNNLADPSFYMQELNECDRRMMELKARKNKILHENRYSKIVTDTKGLVKELEKSDSICTFDTEGFKKHIQKLYITDNEITFVLKNGIELEIEKQEVP